MTCVLFDKFGSKSDQVNGLKINQIRFLLLDSACSNIVFTHPNIIVKKSKE